MLPLEKSSKIKDVLKVIKDEVKSVAVNSINDEIFPESSQANISKIKEATDWQPKLNLADGIRDIIEYEKSKK